MQTFAEIQSRKRALAAPDTILVATDLEDMECLMPFAIAQAKASDAHVTLIHAVEPSAMVAMEPSAIPYIDSGKLARDARVTLLGAVRQFESQGITCDTTVREGTPVVVIAQELSRTKATRLIMGSHGRGKFGQFTMGSVARELITNLDVPVFVVGPQARTAGQHVTPKRILHPVSLKGNYRESLDLAVDIAREYQAELTLLHVLDRGVKDTMDHERTIEWAGNALGALVPEAAKLASPLRTVVSSGKLAEEILKAAAQTDADWIVFGADGGAGLWPFKDGAAYKVLTAAKCPVLTLRHEPLQTVSVKLEEVHFTSPMAANTEFGRP